MPREVETREYKITGTPLQLKEVEEMLAYIMWLGGVGHSTDFTVGVDGDGGARLRIRTNTGMELTRKKEIIDSVKQRMDADGNIKSFCFD